MTWLRHKTDRKQVKRSREIVVGIKVLNPVVRIMRYIEQEAPKHSSTKKEMNNQISTPTSTFDNLSKWHDQEIN